MSLLFALADLSYSLKQQYLRFPAKDSTLDLDFVNNRGLVAGIAGGALDLAAVTRSTTATYFDADRNIQTAAINTARFGYDITSGRMLGLISEPTRSNILLNSLIDKTVLSTQSVTVTAQSYALSFYGTGSITLSGTASDTLTGVSNTVKSILVFTPTAGSLTLTVSGSVFWAQLEAGINSTSFIPTDATSKSRSGDAFLLSDTAFTNWYNQSGGTLIAQYELTHNVTLSRALSINDGTTNNAIEIVAGSGIGVGGYTYINTASSIQGQQPSGKPSSQDFYCVAACYSNSLLSGAGNGVLGALQQAITLPSVNRMYIGASGSNLHQLNGYVRRVTYIPKLLQNPVISGLSHCCRIL